MKPVRLIPLALITAAIIASASAFAAEPAKKSPPPPVPLLKSAEAPAPLPDPVARVNGIPVSAAELTKIYNAVVQSQGGRIPADKVGEVRKKILNDMVSEEIIYQLAKKIDMPDLNKKVEEFMTKHNDRLKADDAYRKRFEADKLSEKELRDLVRRKIIEDNYLQKEVLSKINVTEAEIKGFYDKNPKFFTVPDQIRASHILIKVDPKATDAQKKAARAKVEGLLKQAKSGADFGKLAKENSECPSKENNGDLGFFPKGQMVKQFEDAAWMMKAGEISGIVETQFGYHIIKVTETKASAVVPYSEVRARIEQSIKQQKIREGINALVESARKKAKIEIYLK